MLPAAASLKRQGANKGATTAFLIATPESGIDSIALTYALLDPVITVARPVAALATAGIAGLAQNMVDSDNGKPVIPDLSCPIDNCCDGENCPPDEHRAHHSFVEKLRAGLRFAFIDLWGDISASFLAGLLLAGVISALIPADLMSRYLGGGLPAMLVMLAVGIPMYICATSSTPIAAALILKGVSPGAALVFLLAGPATNMASLTVILGLLGRKGTAIYLGALALCSVLFGLALDWIYAFFNLSPQAMVGQAAEVIPHSVQLMAAAALVALSVAPLHRRLRSILVSIWGKRPLPSAAAGCCYPQEPQSTLPAAQIPGYACECKGPT